MENPEERIKMKISTAGNWSSLNRSSRFGEEMSP
jgi:hypothetical protein